MTKFQEVALSLDALSVENDKLKSINAELLEALEALQSAISKVTVSGGEYANLSVAQGNAIAAIKKARG